MSDTLRVNNLFTTAISNVLYTSLADSGQTAASMTTSGMPGTAPSGSVISGTYRLTAGASAGAAVMRLSSFTYTAGTTYNFTFTGMQGSQTLALYVYQYNSAGTASIQISSDVYTVTTSAATISGSFTANLYPATYTGTIVFYFQALAVNQYVNFTTFSMNAGGMNVGIGATAPAQKLDIVDSASATMGVRLQSQYSAGYLSMGAVLGINSYIGLQSGASTTSALTTPTLCVTNANTIGIGTANPGAVLHIYDSTSSSSSAPLMLFSPNLSVGGAQYMYFGTANSTNNSAQFGWVNVGAGSASNYAFLQIYGRSNIMTWQASTGRVGIGLTNPSATLHVLTSTTDITSGVLSTRYYLRSPGDNQDTSGSDYDGPWYGLGWSGIAGLSGDPYVCLAGFSGVAMRSGSGFLQLAGNGNVGIGITNPSYPLDVAGQARVLNGSMLVQNGNDSFTYYGPNTTWGTSFAVGTGTEKGVCQVFCTDGNLHLDCLAAKDIYIGYHNSRPVNIFNYTRGAGAGDGIITNYTRYFRQYGAIDGDSHAYFQNTNGGTSAYFNLIVATNAGNTNHFMNSTTRTADGGIKAYTIRNDTNGGVRFLSNYGGFTSYGIDGSGGATYTNTIVNYTNSPTTAGGGWAAAGYTVFCNTTQPSNSQPALGLGTNNFNGGYISSIAPGVRWMDLVLSGLVTYVYTNGTLGAYCNTGGWVNVSDEREKEDIHDLKTSRSLERIMKCKPKYYKRKYYEKDKDGNDTTPVPQSEKDTICIGLLAQDVLEHNPHCISQWKNDNIKETDEDDAMRYGINYGDFVVHLIGSVQELNCKITQLTTTTETQATQIATQATQIQDLSSQLTTVLARLSAAGIA